ncbi:RES family NAD+ phosphorylase [Tersicoccus sp. MR15.9]|uniref:RES family NAD+ phosphorylase n=1 Tax=Tersicoccus mangrovi TaxID=3121635 RepID=UPI002FE5DFE6
MRTPPDPFTAQEEILPAGSGLFRVHTNTRRATRFNDGHGAPTRFAFFGDPVVPVLYAGSTEDVAVSETLLHDVPLAGGALLPHAYERTVMSRVVPARPLRLAKFRGTGLRALGAEAADISDTEADAYPDTVRWAQAAHEAGFDGCAWTSRRCNDGAAYVLFGDRVASSDLAEDASFARAFLLPHDLGWLRDFCAPLRVRVLA